MLKIVTLPHPALKKTARPVSSIDKRIVRLVRDMEETLDKQKDPEGVGLSAPQVNVSSRLFIIKHPKEKALKVFINPEIIEKEYLDENGTEGNENMEGCLSIPGIWAPVRRYDRVVVRYQTIQNETKTEEFTGFYSVVVQHEYDHLDGILFTERAIEQGNPIYKEVNGKLREISFV